jgi:hypothetical protein
MTFPEQGRERIISGDEVVESADLVSAGKSSRPGTRTRDLDGATAS